MAIKAYKGKVLVTELQHGQKVLESGIIISDDAGKESGIHPRWAKVYSVGEDITAIQPGEYILIDTGRWSRTITVDGIDMNLVDYPKGVLCSAKERPKQ